jgi:CRISPR-associated endonuclease/helicase Cas3
MDLREGAETPYDPKELGAALKQLQTLSAVGLGTRAALKGSLDEETAMALFPYDPRFVPREKDLFELFDTTPDLTGADIDISRFIRDGRELDVTVYWRNLEGRAPAKRDRPVREELCPIPFYRFKEQIAALLRHGKLWRRHYRKGWEEIGVENRETIYPGQLFLLEQSCGGYNEQRA